MNKNIFFYIKDLLKIAYPIILGNLGFILIGVGDVVVAGRHSTSTLAAVSIATAIINCVVAFGIGVLGSISPVLSNYKGEGRRVSTYFYPSLRFAIALSLVIALIILFLIPVIDCLGIEASLIPMIKDYFWITALSITGAYIHSMAKEFLQTYEIVMFPNLLTIAGVFLNVFLNIIFVFGYGFIPEMGAVGLAWASLLTRYIMGAILIWYCYQKVKIEKCTKRKMSFIYYKDLFKVGIPSSLAIMIEFVAFNSVVILTGRISSIYAAAQNILCTITSVTFMVPLAISNAAALKVGYYNGAKDFYTLRRYAYSVLLMSTGFMSCAALIIFLFPHTILNLFTKDAELIAVGISITYLISAFQIFDGLQVSMAGIFRGLKKTSIVMISNFISYWGISIPLGCILAFHYKLNLFGFWVAIGFSSMILCTIMGTNLIIKFKKLRRNI